MSTVDVIAAVLGSAGTVFGAWGSYAAYRFSRRSASDSSFKEQVTAMIHADNEPLTNRMLKIESELRSLTDGVHGLRTSVDQNTGRHQLLSDRIIALETKVDVFWKNVALDVARVLHSPNPARAHVDELLEAFMEGRISHTERDELKDLLVYIRDYHPGDPSDFPVYPGDQVAAAILLQTIDLVGGPVHR